MLGKRERATFSVIVYLLLCCFCLEGLPLGTCDKLRYFIVALPGPCILLLCTYEGMLSKLSYNFCLS